ncbi:MAG: radical SAM protein, partial [Pseudomonadota bacterium]
MTDHALLRRHGLFDAKVPRYTSYPPATRFAVPVGEENQAAWLAGVREGEEVSIYIHIPFCRRLCWFCACRTQGTQTLSPVASYVETLLTEVDAVRARLPDSVRMARLHLGGGTPTLLSPDLMDLLLSAVFDAFPKAEDFEFSVEIDPTEAAPGVIEALGRWGMTRASIGVQDFHEIVQKAIGRMQSFDETADAVRRLRKLDLHSLNFDLLYGLPFQTKERLAETIDQVLDLSPDRIALFGYAHVPKMSKRQVLIPESELPAPEARFELSSLAKGILEGAGYVTLGIDHYAKPEDSLARAMAERTMRRNFQGYTDDPCET